MADYLKTRNFETTCIGQLRRTEPSEDYPCYGGRDAAKRLFGSAAHISGEEVLGLQFSSGKDRSFSGFVFSDAEVTMEDFAWIFGPYTAPEPAPADVLKQAEYRVQKTYVLRRMPAGEKEEEDDFYDEYGVYAPEADLPALLADTEGTVRIVAGPDGQGGTRGLVLLMLPGDIPLRLRAALSILLPGIEAEEQKEPGEPAEGHLPVSDMVNLTRVLLKSLPERTADPSARKNGGKPDQDREPAEESDPIERLDLSIRACNCLRRAGIHTIAQLRSTSEEELSEIRNLGVKCIREIREKLAEFPAGPGSVPAEQKDPSEELRDLIGLEEVKKQIGRITALARMKKDMADNGRSSVPINLSMEFVGNPGTAKTTVARIAARLFYQTGLLTEEDLLEVGRADLVARYEGQTAEKVREVFRRARGKVLFIDEAYSLLEHSRGEYGDEAINTIVQEMENRREETIVIFAGYPGQMDQFFERNPGLRSRVPFRIAFPDYSAGEMVRIAEREAEKRGFSLGEGARERLMDLCGTAADGIVSGNGRYCRNLVEDAILSYAFRVYGAPGTETQRDYVLTAQDFRIPEPERKKDPFFIGFCA